MLFISEKVEQYLNIEGFAYHDKDPDPQGHRWELEVNNFSIILDAWGDVSLARKEHGFDFSDHIPIPINEFSDFINLVDFCKPFEDANDR